MKIEDKVAFRRACELLRRLARDSNVRIDLCVRADGRVEIDGTRRVFADLVSGGSHPLPDEALEELMRGEP